LEGEEEAEEEGDAEEVDHKNGDLSSKLEAVGCGSDEGEEGEEGEEEFMKEACSNFCCSIGIGVLVEFMLLVKL